MHARALLPALCATALLAAAALPAQAQSKPNGSGAGGPLAIDQAKAEAGGVSPDDLPGFPITLSQPGSYRLTGNIVVPTLAGTAVAITSPGVTLDLNGFEIRGPNACTGAGAALSCPSMAMAANAIRGHGVHVSLQVQDATASVSIENGSIRGFAGNGLRTSGAGYTYTARRLRVSHSGQFGVLNAGAVTESVIDRNAGGGIFGSVGVMHNQVTHNAGVGINGSIARFNASFGNVQADSGNLLID